MDWIKAVRCSTVHSTATKGERSELLYWMAHDYTLNWYNISVANSRACMHQLSTLLWRILEPFQDRKRGGDSNARGSASAVLNGTDSSTVQPHTSLSRFICRERFSSVRRLVNCCTRFSLAVTFSASEPCSSTRTRHAKNKRINGPTALGQCQ